MPFRSPDNFRPEYEASVMIDLAFNKAEGLLKHDKPVIDKYEEDFVKLYGREEVDRDKREVAFLKNEFDSQPVTEGRKLAIILEAFIHDQLESNVWIDENTETILSSDYDDYVNGMDDIVEYYDEGEAVYMGLGIDVTISTDLEDKLLRIKEDIDLNELLSIKYSHSDRTHKTGYIDQVPRVIIEVKADTVRDIAGLWVAGKNKQLSEHPIQIQVLNQILLQLQAFRAYAQELSLIDKQDRSGIISKYTAWEQKVKAALTRKADLIKRLGYDAVDVDDGATFMVQQEVNRVIPRYKKAA